MKYLKTLTRIELALYILQCCLIPVCIYYIRESRISYLEFKRFEKIYLSEKLKYEEIRKVTEKELYDFYRQKRMYQLYYPEDFPCDPV
jgi:hypothetical protein